MSRTARALTAVPFVALSLISAGCQARSTAMDFTLVSPAPKIAGRADYSVDLDPKGASPGDLSTWYATLTRDGKPAGHITGLRIVANLPNDIVGDPDSDERLTLINYAQPDGTIVVAGQAPYPIGAESLKPLEPVVRPVIGGTKAYLGARGEVTTTRQPDNTLVHQFHLIEVNPD